VHILTKILVVFASILAVLLSALTIAYSLNSDALVKGLREERLLRQTAQDQLSAVQTTEANRSQQAQQSILSLTNESNTRLESVRTLETERSRLLAEVQTAKTERDVVLQRLDLLGAAQDNLVKTNEAFRDETIKLRQAQVDASKKELQLIDRLNESENQNNVQEQEIRALREQMTELRAAIAAGRPMGGGIVDGMAGVIAGPSIPVQGVIQEVRRDTATGDLLAMVNVGSNDQLKENMVMMISRGNQFLANLHITRVDLQSAIGRIDTLGKNVSIQNNDRVSTTKR
jgi:hypothetical protein